MKKFIKRFKKLEKTKKLVILFITISFTFILGLTSYNALTDNFEHSTDVVTTENINENNNDKQENKENEVEKEKNQTSDKFEENLEEEKNETTKIEESKDIVNKKDTSSNLNLTNKSETSSNSTTNESNQSSDSNSNQTELNNISSTKEIISVHIQVIGIESTMMNENLNVEKGTNAYKALKYLALQKGIKISTTGFGNQVYVSGIGDLYEKQYGGMSGWKYKVNGYEPNVGAGNYTLQNNDSLVWFYFLE